MNVVGPNLLDRAAGAVTAKILAYAIALILILLALLGLSVTGNITQWADHRAYVKGEADRLKLAAADQTSKINTGLATEARSDNAKLLKDLEEIAERGRTTRVVYRKAADKRPLPLQCAPGQERMDAVNADADR